MLEHSFIRGISHIIKYVQTYDYNKFIQKNKYKVNMDQELYTHYIEGYTHWEEWYTHSNAQELIQKRVRERSKISIYCVAYYL